MFYLDGGVNHPMIQGNRLETIGKLMSKGAGLVCLHYAVEVPKEKGGPEFLDWLGGYYERPYSQMLPKEAPSLETVARATQRADGGRAFGLTGGHFHQNWGIAGFRWMVVNAILWSAKWRFRATGPSATSPMTIWPGIWTRSPHGKSRADRSRRSRRSLPIELVNSISDELG